MAWHPSDRLTRQALIPGGQDATDDSGDESGDAQMPVGAESTGSAAEDAALGLAEPSACSYCGSTKFTGHADNGRAQQATCAVCGGTMSSVGGNQWTPELIGDPSNHPQPWPDPSTGGVGGAANAAGDALVRDPSRQGSVHTADLPRHTDWDEYAHDDGHLSFPIHRGITIWPEDDVYDKAFDEATPKHERAQAVLNHVLSQPNAGTHWTASPDYARKVSLYGTAMGSALPTPDHRVPEHRRENDPMSVVLHASGPHVDHIDRDENSLRAKNVHSFDDLGKYPGSTEEEVPLKSGAPVHITGVSWGMHRDAYTHEQNPRLFPGEPWQHHDFAEPQHHTAAKNGPLSWDEIGERHPHIYGDEDVHGEAAEGADGQGIGDAANHLAHDRPGDPGAENSSVHDLDFHEEHVNPEHIDYASAGRDDYRVKHAMEGYRQHPEKMPPVLLVHRHGVYQVADGHHRAEAAYKADQPTVRAYVAYSPHPDEPFSDGEKAPYYDAEPHPGQRKTAATDTEIPWCAHLYHGNCTYPGDKLPNGTILGIPQDRGPCPWKNSAFQQAACPISAPGPMAVMMVTSATGAGSLDWHDIQQRHPAVYGPEARTGVEEDNHDGWDPAGAAAWLAFDRPERPSTELEAPGESDENVHELRFEHQRVDPKRIDFEPHSEHDPRVRYAMRGYREHPDEMPPVLLVHRHGRYHLADGHHRASAADALGMHVPALVAHSPHPDTPFSDGTGGEHPGQPKTGAFADDEERHREADPHRDLEMIPVSRFHDEDIRTSDYPSWGVAREFMKSPYHRNRIDYVHHSMDEKVPFSENPLRLRQHPDGHLELENGHHRLLAAEERGINEVPAQVRQVNWDVSKRGTALHINGIRRTPKEAAAEEGYEPPEGPVKQAALHTVEGAFADDERHEKTYWRVHPNDRPFGPEHAHSREWEGKGSWSTHDEHTHRGFSAFEDPKSLYGYFGHDSVDENGAGSPHGELPDSHVVKFRGREVGRGEDGEPLVMPSSSHHEKMDWSDFKSTVVGDDAVEDIDKRHGFWHHANDDEPPDEHPGQPKTGAFADDEDRHRAVDPHRDFSDADENWLRDNDFSAHDPHAINHDDKDWLNQIGIEALRRLAKIAQTDTDFAFQVTASWADVRTKAKRIRAEGGVRITVASNDGVAGEVQGDHNIYETALTFVPGSRKIGTWNCGCKWSAYTWGRSPAYRRFEGRSCSHALAMQFEAQSRGMFGKEVEVDEKPPEWLRQHAPVVVQHVRDKGDSARRAVPPGNMRSEWAPNSRVRTKGAHEPQGATDHRPITALAKGALDADEDPAAVLQILKLFGLEHSGAKRVVDEALGRAPKLAGEETRCPHCGGYIGPHAYESGRCPHCGAPLAHKEASAAPVTEIDADAEQDRKRKHHTDDARKHAPEYGYGLPGWGLPVMWCPQCEGSGCGHCGGSGQVVQTDSATPNATANPIPDQNSDAGPAISGGISDTSALRTRAGRAWAEEKVGASLLARDASGSALPVEFSPADQAPASSSVDDHGLGRVGMPLGAGGFSSVDGSGCFSGQHISGEGVYGQVIQPDTQAMQAGRLPMASMAEPVQIVAGMVDDELGWDFAYAQQPHEAVQVEVLPFVDSSAVAVSAASPAPHVAAVAGDKNDFAKQAGGKQEVPTVAGVLLKASDTGRILMLQRGLQDEKDPAKGTWEAPGGHIEPDDLTSLHAAIREFQEEVGQPFPDNGVVHHTWTSPNGVYQGHVVVIPSEKDLDMADGRVVPNPDDPKGDHHEQAAWWDIDHARKNPALRPELKDTPWKDIARAGEQKTASAWDSLESLTPPPGRGVEAPEHSTSQNPGSSGFLTAQDPQTWQEVGDAPSTLAPANSFDATLHAHPEPALPATDGDLDQAPVGYQPPETHGLISDEEESATPDSTHMGSVADIVARFQATAGAQLVQPNGSAPGKDADVSFDIAAAARAHLAGGGLQKAALKDFTHTEQQELINEGAQGGVRARNSGDLKLEGTHYAELAKALGEETDAEDLF